MPSPFPGMDPFIELFEWQDFHTTSIGVIREQLATRVGDGYLVRVERRVYLEHPEPEPDGLRVADVAIVRTGDHGTATALAEPPVAPVECLLPSPEERREAYLVIKDRETREVITVIELLSPGNKGGGSGRQEYLLKREEILEGRSHLVELDLLRGGRRLPMRSDLPEGDYFAIVSRSHRRPRADVYAWLLRQRLPEIAIPLHAPDPDVTLDLQAVHDAVFEQARYQLSLDYSTELEPPVTDDTRRWIADLVSDADE